MHWIVVVALSGAVSTLIAHLIVRGKRERIGVGSIVAVLDEEADGPLGRKPTNE